MATRLPTPANDNGPRRATDFPDLAARRAWLATLPTSAPRTVQASPTITRLARAGRLDAVEALLAWHELTAPVADVTVVGQEEGERQRLNQDMNIGGLSVDVIVDAAYRGTVTRHRDGTREAAPAYTHAVTEWPDGTRTWRCGDVRFDASCRMVGVRVDGAWRSPKTRWRSPRPDGRVGHVPAPANDNWWMGGSQEDEAGRAIDARRLRERMGRHADVLDMALTDATASDIAVAVEGREPGKYAERRGVALVEAAIKALAALEPKDATARAA